MNISLVLQRLHKDLLRGRKAFWIKNLISLVLVVLDSPARCLWFCCRIWLRYRVYLHMIITKGLSHLVFAADIAKQLGSRDFKWASDLLCSYGCLHDWRAFQSYQSLTCIARRRRMEYSDAEVYDESRFNEGQELTRKLAKRNVIAKHAQSCSQYSDKGPSLLVAMLALQHMHDNTSSYNLYIYAQHLAVSFCLFSLAIL